MQGHLLVVNEIFAVIRTHPVLLTDLPFALWFLNSARHPDENLPLPEMVWDSNLAIKARSENNVRCVNDGV